MSELEFNYDDLDKFEADLDRWPGLALAVAEPAMQDAVWSLQGEIPEPPPGSAEVVQKPDGVTFLTDRQRRWFFMSVQAGDIPGWRWAESGARRLVARETIRQRAKYESIGGGHPEKYASGRTNQLERNFTVEVIKSEESVVGSIGTNLEYAPWVVGSLHPGEEIRGEQKYQAKIHENRWFIFSEEIRANLDDAWRKFDDRFWPEFQKQLDRVKRS